MTPSKGAVVRRITVAAAAAAAMIAPVVATAPSANAAGSVTSAVSLTAPRAAAYGSSIKLTGVVWRYGTRVRIPGAAIVLQRSVHGKNKWANFKATRSAANGTFAFSVTQGLAYDYRARYGGSAVYKPATSAVRYPVVVQKVFFDAIATINADNGHLRAVGRVYPTPPRGSLVYLQRYDSKSKTYKNLTSTRSSGSPRVIFNARVGGSTAWYRIYAPTRVPYGAGASVGKVFAHYVWRGAFKKPLLGRGGTGGGQFQVVTDPNVQHAGATAFADPGGSAWGDVNTAGCIRIRTLAINVSSEAARYEVLRGSTALIRDVVPGGGESPDRDLAFPGTAKLRAQVTDTGASEELGVGIIMYLRCRN